MLLSRSQNYTGVMVLWMDFLYNKLAKNITYNIIVKVSKMEATRQVNGSD